MKNIIILLLILSALTLQGCATKTDETETGKAKIDENKDVPETLLNFVKIKKLYMCHYFFAYAAKGVKDNEKLLRISLSLKFKAAKLAAATVDEDLIKRVSGTSMIGFRKFMSNTSKIEDKAERNKAFNTFARSCAVTAGVKLKN
ncbi:MAG: hypothetical protein OEY78_04510 [Gammaproteobacteria bacterium]|nr:hypothetical protein [Gammaproteobacteria bacterium]